MVVSSIVFFLSWNTISALRIREHTLEEVGQPALHEVGQRILEENVARHSYSSATLRHTSSALLLCEFARKKENPSLERFIASPFERCIASILLPAEALSTLRS